MYNFSETRQKNENFGSSLLLANSPMSPKIVNGSFAAIYDTADVFNECMKTFGRNLSEAMDSPGILYKLPRLNANPRGQRKGFQLQ